MLKLLLLLLSVSSLLFADIVDDVKSAFYSSVNATKDGVDSLVLKGELFALEQNIAQKEALLTQSVINDLKTNNTPMLYSSKTTSIFRELKPLYSQKAFLEKSINTLKVDKTALELEAIENFNKSKAKLDVALSSGVISSNEFNAMVKELEHEKKHFFDFYLLDKQLELGLITREEHRIKLAQLKQQP